MVEGFKIEQLVKKKKSPISILFHLKPHSGLFGCYILGNFNSCINWTFYHPVCSWIWNKWNRPFFLENHGRLDDKLLNSLILIKLNEQRERKIRNSQISWFFAFQFFALAHFLCIFFYSVSMRLTKSFWRRLFEGVGLIQYAQRLWTYSSKQFFSYF